MLSFGDENPECKRCGHRLESNHETQCPRCQFSPRQRGLQVGLGLLMLVVVLMTVVVLVPEIGGLLLPFVALSFLLSLLTVLASFLVTPSRFGSLFLW
ncbi:MAG: hypothetical protein PPP58_08405 [Natronomonas sp.]